MDLRFALPMLLPDAIVWATGEAARVVATGDPLSPLAIDVARCVGVSRPEEIRVLVVDALPLPEKPALREAALQILDFGYGAAPFEIDAREHEIQHSGRANG